MLRREQVLKIIIISDQLQGAPKLGADRKLSCSYQEGPLKTQAPCRGLKFTISLKSIIKAIIIQRANCTLYGDAPHR